MSPVQRWLLHVSAILVGLSGILYGALKYFGEPLARAFPSVFPSQDDPFSVVSHPIQPWSLHLHVLSAPVLIFAVGWVFKDHIVGKISGKGPAGRASGLLQAGILVPMALTGYLLQTITRETIHRPVMLVHVAVGLLFLVAYALHAIVSTVRRVRNGNGATRRAA